MNLDEIIERYKFYLLAFQFVVVACGAFLIYFAFYPLTPENLDTRIQAIPIIVIIAFSVLILTVTLYDLVKADDLNSQLL